MPWWCNCPTQWRSTTTRQSITLSEPNDQWLQAQVESREYASKSEAVNDLIRQTRKRQDTVDALSEDEASGLSDRTIDHIKEGLRRSVHHAHGIYFTVSHQGVVIVRVQGRPNFSAAVEE